jgi:acyl-CoA thioester hydrolase
MSDYSETTLRVRYVETDKMGVVYYANYYIYFEVGRVEYMRERGVNYRQMELEDDCFIVVAESQCRYHRAARYDDPLRIRTRVAESRRRTIRFAYEIIHGETGELLASGETLHVVCDSHGRPKSLPDKYRRFFDGAAAAKASAQPVK